MTDLSTAIEILRPELKARRELKYELFSMLHSQTTYFSVIPYDIFDIIEEFVPLLHKTYEADCFDIPTKRYAEFLAKHEIINRFELQIRASDFGETLSYAVANYRYIKLLDSGPVIIGDDRKMYLGNNTFVFWGALIKTMDIHWFKILPCGLIIICRTKPWSTDLSIQRAFLVDGARYNKNGDSYALPTEHHENTFMINFDTDRPRHVELDIRLLPLEIYCNNNEVCLVDDYGWSKLFPKVSQNVYKSSQYSVECLSVQIGE